MNAYKQSCDTFSADFHDPMKSIHIAINTLDELLNMIISTDRGIFIIYGLDKHLLVDALKAMDDMIDDLKNFDKINTDALKSIYSREFLEQYDPLGASRLFIIVDFSL